MRLQWVSTIDLDEQLVTSLRPLDHFRPAAVFTILDEFEARNESVVLLSRFTYTASGQWHAPVLPAGQADTFTERVIYEGISSGPKSMGILGHMLPQVPWVHPTILAVAINLNPSSRLITGLNLNLGSKSLSPGENLPLMMGGNLPLTIAQHQSECMAPACE